MHGLQTSLLICDGAGPNFSALKTTHGHSGMYEIGEGANACCEALVFQSIKTITLHLLAHMSKPSGSYVKVECVYIKSARK